jgi:hypothetical protein
MASPFRTFSEALSLTADLQAAPSYLKSLYERGSRLIKESLLCGVTAIRAHVEVDETVGLEAIRIAERLKVEWEDQVYIQIAGKSSHLLLEYLLMFRAAFAQKPMFTESGKMTEVLKLMQEVLGFKSVEVVGSAPYVEPSRELQERNVDEILNLASACSKQVDFHIDYDLKPVSSSVPEPLLFYLLKKVEKTQSEDSQEAESPPKRITLGHATRFSQFTDAEWMSFLRDHVVKSGAGLHLIGLPQSDVYMMGKAEGDMSNIGKLNDRLGERKGAGARVRGTLDIPRISSLVKAFKKSEGDNSDKIGDGHDGFEWVIGLAMAVNNVGNPFTPQGGLDPLSLCPLGVCVYQDGTSSACRTLLVGC